MKATSTQLEQVHVEIAAADEDRKKLHRKAGELRVAVEVAKASMLTHGFVGDMPEDIQLYCRTTYCHSNCRYSYCDRPHNCYFALHADTATATAIATVTATDH